MNYIKFIMRKERDNITLPMLKAEQILKSPQQLVMINDDQGRWTGVTINKADIVKTERDYDKEHESRMKAQALKPVEEYKQTPEEYQRTRRSFQETREYLESRGILIRKMKI